MIHPARRDDDGAALIIVLILVTVIALGLGALLSFADTSLRSTMNLRGQAATAAGADGAIQAAITNIRNSTYRAAAGTPCFDGGDTLSLPAFDGATSAAVTCNADPASVLIQCPSLTQCNRPGTAILTLGSIPGEAGVTISQPNTSAFRVHGTVFSNSTINVASGSLNTTGGPVYARGTCSGTIQSTPAAQCSYAGASSLGADPGYPPGISTVPAYQPLPSCTTANSVVRFSPGYYDDAAKLSAMMDGNSACKHSTWWFQPGTYYFDFHNSGANGNPLLASGANVWTISDGYLVAGAPIGADGTPLATPAVPASIPGACNNPINDNTAVGVQFIFGGDSQMVVDKDGQAELCGTYSATKPPVAVYGLTSGGDSPTAATLKVSGVPAAGAFTTGATATNLANADSTKFATWTSGKKNDNGTVTVDGFAPPAGIPAGSVLKNATVRVVHRHGDAASSDDLSVTVTPSGGTPVSTTLSGHTGGTAWQTDQAAVDTGGGSIARAVYAGTFTGARIAVTAGLAANKDTEDIDAIQLDLTYLPPALRAQTGCVVTGPYTTTGSATSCALITNTGSPKNRFYVQGTTYAPRAVLDVTLNNISEQVFRFGVISRALRVKQTGSFSYTGPVIEVPDDAPGYAFAAYLTAYVCPGDSSCPATGTGALRAKVSFVDEDPMNPIAGRRKVVILSWVPSG